MEKPEVVCFGVSHKSAPMSIREHVYFDAETLGNSLQNLKLEARLSEIFVLSTCNRFEIYAISNEVSLDHGGMKAVLQTLSRIAQVETPPSDGEIKEHYYLYRGLSCLEHAYAVASSLDSLVIGETQITGQFKDALRIANDAGTLGPYFGRLSQEILSTVKQVRSKTSIGEKTVSISHAAIDLAKRVFRSFEERSFLLIGAGEMAEVAAKYVLNYKPKDVLVVNRSIERAQSLIDELSTGRAYALDDLHRLLLEADIVISSTSARQAILSRQDMERIMTLRHRRPLFIVDISIPRDIDPNCSEIEDLYLFEIDDLEKIVADNMKNRLEEAQKARVFTKKGAEQFDRWLASYGLKPILSDFKDYATGLVQREFDKTIQKNIYKSLSDQQLEGIQSMLDSVAAKLVADAAKAINRTDNGYSREQLAAAIKAMFNEKHHEATKDERPCEKNIVHL